MGNLNITNRVDQKYWSFTEEGWKLDGSSQQGYTEHEIRSFNCSINKVVGEAEQYVGFAQGNLSDGELKISINDVPTSMLADVAQVLEDLQTALLG